MNKIYPIIFHPYTMGSSLSYLLSLHNGFYSYCYGYSPSYDESTPSNYIRPSFDGSILSFENDYDNVIDGLKNYDKNLKYSIKFNKEHFKLDMSFYPNIGTNVFPIVIKLNKFLMNSIIKRLNTVYDSYKEKFIERYSNILENWDDNAQWYDNYDLIEMYKRSKNHFLIIDIVKLYNNDEDEYGKLCNFIEEPPRIDIKQNINSIKKVIKFDSFIQS